MTFHDRSWVKWAFFGDSLAKSDIQGIANDREELNFRFGYGATTTAQSQQREIHAPLL
jgi:hypothetical protein